MVANSEYLHGVNIGRFKKIFGPRRKRNPEYRASQMSELKACTFYREGLCGRFQAEVCAAIEAPFK